MNIEAFKTEAKTSRTLRNIRRTIEKSLKDKYRITSEDKIDKILKLHGLHKNHFDFVANIENVLTSKLNDVSIDDNSNKESKTIEGIHAELFYPVKKAIGYDLLYRMMKTLYGRDEAKRLSGEMYDYSLALADSTKILSPYCWACDASKLVTEGRPFGQLQSKPAKRISSYISALCETIHQLTNHLAGAIAVGTLFIDMAHILLYKEKISFDKLKNDDKIRKKIENEFQQFVHSVNHLSRIDGQSPFSNISIFDKPKLKALISPENMGWYFQGTDLEDAINYILELQNIFLDFFDKGDPLAGGLPYRFPVVTMNLSKKLKDTEYDVEDKIFLSSFCKRDVYRYNILVSEGSRVASCCRLLSDNDMLSMAGQVNSFGGGGLSLGSHRVVTINLNRIALESDSKEDFFNILQSRLDSCGKILSAHKQLIELETAKGLQPFITYGWITLKRMFSTVGIIGLTETNQTLVDKKIITKNIDIIKDILIFINQKTKDLSKEYDIICNIEQIPAESMAVKLVKADKVLFGDKNVPYNLYANQFIPLWQDSTIFERLETDGRYNKLITGGGIVHAQIGEKVTAKQAENIIKFAVKSGCEHFALNAVYSECENKHVTFGKADTCSICGKQIKDRFTRVVGFFTRVSSWNETRREWEFPKRTFIDIKSITDEDKK